MIYPIHDQSRHVLVEVDTMKPIRYVTMVALLILATLACQAADGLIVVASPYSVGQTMDRAEDLAKQRGLTIFARIDHAAEAARAGLSLRPTQLLIFGHAKGGTPLMECVQTAGIDLPLKTLVWEDELGKVWLGYNDPVYLMKRHGAPRCPAAENVAKALASLVERVVAP
jgi:uncharacterized protein (DUF302 family)